MVIDWPLLDEESSLSQAHAVEVGVEGLLLEGETGPRTEARAGVGLAADAQDQLAGAADRAGRPGAQGAGVDAGVAGHLIQGRGRGHPRVFGYGEGRRSPGDRDRVRPGRRPLVVVEVHVATTVRLRLGPGPRPVQGVGDPGDQVSSESLVVSARTSRSPALTPWGKASEVDEVVFAPGQRSASTPGRAVPTRLGLGDQPAVGVVG